MFDSHCHLDFEELAPELPRWLAEARALGVERWFVPGCEPTRWERVQALTSEPGVEVGHGVHPWWAGELEDLPSTWAELERRLEGRGVVAVGECGLDGVRVRGAPLERQREVFEAQLELARRRELPVVLHQVRAREAFLRSLDRVGLPSAGGVVHGFQGDGAWAHELLRRGLHLGIGPAVSRPGRDGLRAAVRGIPAERLLVETDAPDQGLDGQRGRLGDLARVVAAVARLRGQPVEEVGRRTAANAEALFRSGAPALAGGKSAPWNSP